MIRFGAVSLWLRVTRGRGIGMANELTQCLKFSDELFSVFVLTHERQWCLDFVRDRFNSVLAIKLESLPSRLTLSIVCTYNFCNSGEMIKSANRLLGH